MNKFIEVAELQRTFRAAFDEVAHNHASYILTRNNRPEAVLIPYELYLKYVRADEAAVLRRMDEALARMAQVNAPYSDEEVEADLVEATWIVRARKARPDALRR